MARGWQPDPRSIGCGALLLVAAACSSGPFAYNERELVDCWPACADAGPGDAGPDGAVEPDAAELDATEPDAAESHDATEPDAADPLMELEVAWSTSHSITWEWDPEEMEPEVHSYLLRIDDDMLTVHQGGGDGWGAEQDPHLGYRDSPHLEGLVRRTTVTDLVPRTAYFARLYAEIDGVGLVPVAQGSGATLGEPDESASVYSEELHPEAQLEGWSEYEGEEHAHTGVHALHLIAEGDQWHEGGVYFLEVNLEGIPEGRWSLAFIEYFIKLEFAGNREPVYVVQTSVGGATHSFMHSYVVLPQTEGWRRIQIPLRMFFGEEELPCTRESMGGVLRSFELRAEWPNDTAVYIDDVALHF